MFLKVFIDKIFKMLNITTHMPFIIIAGKRIIVLDNNYHVLEERELDNQKILGIIENKEIGIIEELKEKYSARMSSDKQRKRFWELVREKKIILKKNFEEILREERELGIEYSKQRIDKEFGLDKAIIMLSNTLEETRKARNIIGVKLREFISMIDPKISKEEFENAIRIINEKGINGLIEEYRIGFIPSKIKIIEKTIRETARKYIDLYSLGEEINREIELLMKEYCPNFLSITGPSIGSKLLAQAGSMKNLVEMPSSTIQLLGAEKALFRHLTTGARAPKHGYILQHPIVKKAKKKGRAARALAEVISMAVRIDYFSGRDATKELEELLEKKLRVIEKK